VENESRDLKTFKLAFLEKSDEEKFKYTPGQFAELSLAGFGESPIGIASSPTEKGFLLFTVKKVGLLTSELHSSDAGRIVGVRGPLGIPYPIDRMKGKDIVIIGGGFAFTTLRSTITYILDEKNRKDFGKLIVVYGARTPGELIYKDDLRLWEKRSDMEMFVTVDKKAPADEWPEREGFVPAITKQVAPQAKNAIALVCGPPIMIKFTIPVLKELNFSEDDIILSLEMRMKCGIGKCGRCNIGHKYVCKDGPVFTLKELSALPAEY
jgi:NAD(P)H-flavin reductase